MDAARAAVGKITGRTGHRTDVDEVVNPQVVAETIKPHRHEETTEAVDREVHQHHYHTTVQPIAHKETLPEKHVHNLAPKIEREYRHDNESETHRKVSAELGQFKNTTTVQQPTQSRQVAPQAIGEHVHHHVHETVQPVIHKETVQPEVIHTTVPIHETHIESAQHHGMSALPMKTLDEFTRAGGIVGGSKSHTHEEYEGAPRPYNDKLKTTIDKILPGHHNSSSSSSSSNSSITGAGITGHNTTGSGLTGHNTTGSGLTGHNTTGSGLTGHNTSGSGLTGHNTTGSGLTGHNTSGSGLTGTHGARDTNLGTTSSRSDHGVGSGNTSGTHKPSLMDKLNPKVDANGDGKAGFMK